MRAVVMGISIHSLLEGAERATGSVAIVDVFRAFTTAAVALANGASKIVMVRTVEEAKALRETGIGQICMGEVHGRAPDEFNFWKFAVRELGYRFRRQDDHPADQRRYTGDR